eukprot:6193517-Pleurochrysis_carterae.AAC.3
MDISARTRASTSMSNRASTGTSTPARTGTCRPAARRRRVASTPLLFVVLALVVVVGVVPRPVCASLLLDFVWNLALAAALRGPVAPAVNALLPRLLPHLLLALRQGLHELALRLRQGGTRRV